MIGSLRGQLLWQGVSELIVDVAGVGYRVTSTPATIAELASSAGEVVISVHTHVREDALVLYGFASDDDRAVFELLLGTHGVGPALALAIVGTLGADEVVRAVKEGDGAAFEAVSGVGKKTAARLVLELHGALEGVVQDVGLRSAPAGGIRSDVAAALSELGYGSDEIRAAMSEIDESQSAELALRSALRELRQR